MAIDPATGDTHVKTRHQEIHKIVLTDEEGYLAETAGKGAQVRLYGPNGNPINVTTEGAGDAVDAHITNPTIEQTTGAAHSDESIAVAAKDTAGNVQPLQTDTARRLLVRMMNAAVPEEWDYVALTQDTTTDTWTFKTGGSGGTTVKTVLVTYTDSSKATIDNVGIT